MMIRTLRKELHQIPELSFQEYKTKERLMSFLKEHTGLKVVDCGSWFYAYYQGTRGTKTIALRGDMDAVCGKDGRPGHYCGHDGHSAILAGTALRVWKKQPENRILFLFQPAEETGEGAKICLEILKEFEVSEIYGFHNIPGRKLHSILLNCGTFACASTGMEITIKGTPSHAAYPEAGKNPAEIFARLILNKEDYLKDSQGLTQMTVIGLDLGSDSYGVSASEGILRLTVRGEYEAEFQTLVKKITDDACGLSEEAGMECQIQLVETFPATENHRDCVKKVEAAAVKLGYPVIVPDEPFRWSEDFGYYLQQVPGAFFGIGDGEDWPGLHTEGYEFPDEIIETAIQMFLQLAES